MTSEQVPSGSGRDLLSADLIGERSFAVVRRGFDRDEVQEFLKQVAGAIRSLHHRLEQVEDARRQAEQRALHPEINEDVLMERVGEETATILRSARAAAGDMRTRAAEEAARIVDQAHQRAGEIRGEAEAAMGRSMEEANRAAEELRAGAQTAGDQMVERARQEVESLRQMAEQERKLTVEGAQSIREKILADLGRRRRVATVQIEQLRAGRERLLESYGLVRRTLEEVQDELQRADAEARGAAEQVGRDRDEEDSADLLPDLLGASAATSPGPTEADVPGDAGPSTEVAVPVDAGLSADADAVAGAVAEVGAEVKVDGPGAPEADTGSMGAVATEATITEIVVTETVAVEEQPAKVEEQPATAEEEPEAPTPRAQAGRKTTPGRRKTGQERPATRPASRRREVPAEDPPGRDPAGEDLAAADPPVADPPVADPPAADPPVVAVGDGVTATEPGLGGVASVGAPSEPGQEGEGPEASVDGLFARIRAGREEAVTQARQVLSGENAADAEVDGLPADSGAGADESGRSSRSDDETDAGLARTGEDEALLERREAALGEVEVILTRKLKRALQDEQNSLLDRLRASPGEPDPATLLGAVAEHRQRYVDAALPQLELAARAGSRFALEVVNAGGRKAAAPKRPAKVDDLAAELAATLSDHIRRRVEQALQSAGGVSGRGDDQSATTEALGAAYRETKTQRVERTAGDQVTAAFSRGIWETAGDRVPLRWVVEDIDGPCPDCDDNALAGALPRHEGFPTGQAHPPAHTGCRCLVVPDLR